MGRKKGKTPIFSIDNVSGLHMITINKTNRPDISKVFSLCLKRVEEETARQEALIMRCMYGGSDDYYAYQQALLKHYQKQHKVNVKSSKKSNKRGSRGGQKKKCINQGSTLNRLFNNIHDTGNGTTIFDSTGIFSRESFEDFCNEHDVSHGDKMIYFYDDIMDSNSKTVYYDVYDLDEYCKENNIEISDYDCKHILSQSIIHCCVNPYARTVDGKKMLMVESSYGGLRWLCCDSNDELEDEYAHISNC